MSEHRLLPASGRVGIDVGGTFTDVVFAAADGRQIAFKVPSTPDDPSRAVLAAVDALERTHGVDAQAIEALAHGTTVATNAVIERKGAVVGLIATAGFSDVLEIGRQMRTQMYSVCLDPETPVFIAPGAMRVGVRERIGPCGEVIEPLDEDEVRRALETLADRGAQAIAVSLLFSFLNPTHEQRIRELADQHYPELMVSLSSEVDPAFREYERTAVTAFDAYIKPTVSRYLQRLGDGIRDRGIDRPLKVMRSRGGLSRAELAVERPVQLFLSGPAAGVLGAQAAGECAHERDLISVDIGGTSCDIALVSEAKALIRPEGEIGGYPVRVPMVDVNAIGAGGGSIAWIDRAGGLRVGPHSAGSDPGPACYARGGEQPTATDASLVLGLLDAQSFAGGSIALDGARAAEAIERHIARPLGIDTMRAATGIHRVLNAQMAEGIRLVSIRQGFDPRGFTLLPLGGAGALHACALAEELQMSRVLVPPRPGVLSAAGLLSAPVEHAISAAFGAALETLEMETVRARLDELDARCRALMNAEAIAADDISVEHFADVCYAGQGYHLEVPLTLSVDDPLVELRARFLSLHERVYGYAAESPVRIVNLRSVHCAGARPLPAATHERGGIAQAGSRSVHLGEYGEVRRNVRTVARDALATGDVLDGPTIVDQADTTVWVAPGWSAEVLPCGSLAILSNERGKLT